MNSPWAKMPLGWQTKPETYAAFSTFLVGPVIAALKLYVLMCLNANYRPSDRFSRAGSVQFSITQLAEMSGLSRPMVIAGLRVLHTCEIISTSVARPTIYHIVDYDTAPNWTKLPKRHLWRPGRRRLWLGALSSRRRVTMDALMLYLYLASIRDRKNDEAKVSYFRIRDVLGIDTKRISNAISLLIAYDLISVRSDTDETVVTSGHPVNRYRLRE